MSNKRKITHICAERGCVKTATIQVTAFDDDGTHRGSQWLCREHAVRHAHSFEGKVWGDARCSCGNVDHVLNDAGRTRHGNL